jgi:glycosyltransferase involved in cell wall biosynthesis
MMLNLKPGSASTPPAGIDARPLIVIGITHAQTCMVLAARLRALKAAGFRVVLISSPGALLDEIVRNESIEAMPISMARGFAPFADVRTLLRLWRVLARLRPEICEFSTPKAGLLGNVAARLCRIPVRVYLLRGLRLETLTGLRYRLALTAERIAAFCAHHVVCSSKSLREKAVALRIAPQGRMHLLGEGSSQGVDIFRFAPGAGRMRETLATAVDPPVIGFVGRLTRDKGIPELIEAFDRIRRAIPSARLLLVGWFDDSEDALDEALRCRIVSHPSIFLTGYVHDTAPYYQVMDMLVLPTWREGFPNVVLEASASGIPVITTIATGSRDAVLPEVTGLLIPAGYSEAIAEAVLRLVRNADERARMGSAGRAWVIQRFANEDVLRLTVSFYRRLLEDASRERAAVLITDVAAVAD